MASGLLERNQIHKREDVLDLITRTDEKQTPFTSRVRKGRTPHNTFMQWTVDAYDPPKLGGVVDGTDVSTFENHAENRAMLRTYLQTHRRTAKVSPDAQEVSDVAGLKGDEMSEAIAKKLEEIGRDIEATCLSDQEHQEDDGAENPRLGRGLGIWIRDTTNIAAQTLYEVPEAYRPNANQIVTTATANITEDDIQTLFQEIYDQTGMSGSYALVCGSTLRRRITDMTRFAQYADSDAAKFSRQFNYDGGGARVRNSVSVYEGDYGTVEVVSSNFIGAGAPPATFATDKGRGYLLDMSKVELASFKQPTVKPLPNLGGGERTYIEAKCALRILNPLGLGQFNTALS
jgi:hypothetical protein